MKSFFHKFFILLIVTLALPLWGVGGSHIHAQGQDPTLAAMILLYTDKAKKELKQQEEMMLLESTGDNFHGIIMYAAQIYGFYHEIDHLIGNLDAFSKQLSAHPSNALAVALSSNRNKIYREIILNSVDICNDVRQVCLSDTKMTEKERMEVIFGIRPKLKLMNKKLQRLTKAVKYTSLGDVWAEIDYHARTGADKKNIVEESMLRWKRAAKR